MQAGLQRIGPYVVVRELARGAMGAVLQARHAQLGRDVAIKVLLSAGSTRARERFALEARALARLNHPNLVRVHDVGEDPEAGPYLVMDYVQGETLADRIHREGALDPHAAARLIRKLAEALSSAHRAAILHRDVKPANVLLNREGEPLLTDFGLARDEIQGGQRLTQTGQMLGTPAYMPPEQARGALDEIDRRSDVYSLGATLYECLTGETPFDGGGSSLGMAAQIASELPQSPHRLRPGIPLDLSVICLKCLEKDPRDRYPSARALAADLGRFLEERPIEARPPGMGTVVRKWVRRNRIVTRWVGASLLVLVGGLVLSGGIFVRRLAAETRRAQHERDEARRAQQAERAQLERAQRLLGEALELKGDQATAQRAWREAAACYAVSLARGETVRRRLLLQRALSRSWRLRRLPLPEELPLPAEVRRRQSHPLARLILSDDGRRVAAALRDGRVASWSLESGEVEVLSPVGARGVAITSLALDSRGQQLAAGDASGAVTLWRAGRPALALRGAQPGSSVGDLTWAGDDDLLIGRLSQGPLLVWRPAVGSDVRSLGLRVLAYCLGPARRRVALAEAGGRVTIVRLEDGEVLARFESGVVVQLSWAPHGAFLAGLRPDRSIWVAPVNRGSGAPRRRRPEAGQGPLWRDLGGLVAAVDADRSQVLVVNAMAGREHAKLSAGAPIRRVSWAPQHASCLLAETGVSTTLFTIQPPGIQWRGSSVSGAHWSPSGKGWASRQGRALEIALLLEPSRPQRLVNAEPLLEGPLWVDGGTLLSASERGLQVWESPGRPDLTQITLPSKQQVHALAPRPAGKEIGVIVGPLARGDVLLSGAFRSAQSYVLGLAEVKADPELSWFPGVTEAAWSPAGELLAAARPAQGQLSLLGPGGDVRGQLPLTPHDDGGSPELAWRPGPLRELAVADSVPDAGSGEHELRVYDVRLPESPTLRAKAGLGEARVLELAWSPGGEQLLGRVRRGQKSTYELRAGVDLGLRPSPAGLEQAQAACWTARGLLFAVGNQLRQVVNSRTVATLDLPWAPQVLLLAPDETRLAVAGPPGRLALLEYPSLELLVEEPTNRSLRLAWSPTSAALAYAGPQGVRLLQASDGRVILSEISLASRDDPVTDLCWARDGTRLLFGEGQLLTTLRLETFQGDPQAARAAVAAMGFPVEELDAERLLRANW